MSFLRIDIPARKDTAVETEEVARAVAAKLSPEPVTTWDVKALMPAQSKTPVAAPPSFIDNDDEVDDEVENDILRRYPL
jgi:hypothetical protein